MRTNWEATEPFTDWIGMPTYFSQKARRGGSGGRGGGVPPSERSGLRGGTRSTRSPAPKSLTPKGRAREQQGEGTFSSLTDGAGGRGLTRIRNDPGGLV